MISVSKESDPVFGFRLKKVLMEKFNPIELLDRA